MSHGRGISKLNRRTPTVVVIAAVAAALATFAASSVTAPEAVMAGPEPAPRQPPATITVTVKVTPAGKLLVIPHVAGARHADDVVWVASPTALEFVVKFKSDRGGNPNTPLGGGVSNNGAVFNKNHPQGKVKLKVDPGHGGVEFSYSVAAFHNGELYVDDPQLRIHP